MVNFIRRHNPTLGAAFNAERIGHEEAPPAFTPRPVPTVGLEPLWRDRNNFHAVDPIGIGDVQDATVRSPRRRTGGIAERILRGTASIRIARAFLKLLSPASLPL